MLLRTKVFLGFLILISMTVAGGLYAVSTVAYMKQLAADMYDKQLMSINYARAAKSDFLVVDRQLMTFQFGLDTTEIEDVLENIESEFETFIEDLEVVAERAGTQRTAELITKIVAQSEEWRGLVDAHIRQLDEQRSAEDKLSSRPKRLESIAQAIYRDIDLIIELRHN